MAGQGTGSARVGSPHLRLFLCSGCLWAGLSCALSLLLLPNLPRSLNIRDNKCKVPSMEAGVVCAVSQNESPPRLLLLLNAAQDRISWDLSPISPPPSYWVPVALTHIWYSPPAGLGYYLTSHCVCLFNWPANCPRAGNYFNTPNIY